LKRSPDLYKEIINTPAMRNDPALRLLDSTLTEIQDETDENRYTVEFIRATSLISQQTESKQTRITQRVPYIANGATPTHINTSAFEPFDPSNRDFVVRYQLNKNGAITSYGTKQHVQMCLHRRNADAPWRLGKVWWSCKTSPQSIDQLLLIDHTVVSTSTCMDTYMTTWEIDPSQSTLNTTVEIKHEHVSQPQLIYLAENDDKVEYFREQFYNCIARDSEDCEDMINNIRDPFIQYMLQLTNVPCGYRVDEGNAGRHGVTGV